MEMDGLRAELERLFELDELMRLSSELLGLDPEEIGGVGGKATFVRALTEHCDRNGAVEALCDAVLAFKPHANGELSAARHVGLADRYDVPKGSELLGFVIHHKLAEGPDGTCYLATRGSAAFRVKILHRQATRDPIGVQRFLTFCRILTTLATPASPKRLEVGRFERRVYLAHELFDGEALSVRLARTGALPVSETLPIMSKTAAALGALHAARQCHGNLKLENVIAGQLEGAVELQLQDAGSDLLRPREAPSGRIPTLCLASPKTSAPELLRGGARSPTSDVYAFGATFYELLCGRAPFVAESGLDTAIAHLTRAPEPPSTYAPRGWIPELLDRFMLLLLSKDPSERPENGEELRVALERLWSAPSVLDQVSPDELDTYVDALLADPSDAAATQALEALAVGPARKPVYEAFARAAGAVDAEAGPDQLELKRALLLRAAAGLRSIGDLRGALAAYEALTELGELSFAQWDALDEIRAQLGQHEEIIEGILSRIDRAPSPRARAELMARIGEIYEKELDDTEQAAIAFTQAFCEAPTETAHAKRVEAVVEGRDEIWNEVIAACSEASSEDRDPSLRIPILEQMGSWYLQKLARPELALPCFQAALKLDPKRRSALDGVAQVYRVNKMWSELGDLLIHRAEISASPSEARELRSQAAQLFEARLNDKGRARELYEQVLADDPEHSLAHQSLSRLYEESGELDSLIPLLRHQAEGSSSASRQLALLKLGDLHRTRLGDLTEARRCYERLLDEQPDHLEARQGLDQVLAQSGAYKELLDSLHRQLKAAPTPRRQVALWERIATICEEEFLLHTEAAAALEQVLALDPSREQAMLGLERLYRTLERWTDLAELYRRHSERCEDPERKIALLLQRARVLAEHTDDAASAIAVYQQVLTLAPDRRDALEALADLQEALGNPDEAVRAVQHLADQAGTSEAKVRYYLRTARLLESRGRQDEAIECYARALDLDPANARASAALRTAYAARGDAASMIALLRRDIAHAEGARAKARLCAEMAALQYTRLKDAAAAEKSATEALEWDPSNLSALVLMGDICFDRDRFSEARTYYQQVIPRTDALVTEDAVRVLTRYLDAETRAPSIPPSVLLSHSESLLSLAPDNLEVVARTASLAFEQGDYARARALYEDYLERFRQDLDREALAEATYRLGESLRQTDELELALTCLHEALELAPSSSPALTALAKAYEAKGDFEAVLKTRTRLLELSESPVAKARISVELGELLLDRLGDRERALASLRTAAELVPEDRKVLTRLMQIYSNHQVWDELVPVLERLARFVEDARQKSKYLMTAAMVSARHLAQKESAIQFYRQVLELDPDNGKALSELVVLQLEREDFEGAEESLLKQLDLAQKNDERRAQLDVLEALARLYQRLPDRLDDTITTLEAAAELDPGNQDYPSQLADLYERDLTRYGDRAVAVQLALLRREPDRVDAYKKLRVIYTETRRADAAWCLCQVLSLLRIAEPDEVRFFERVRSDQPAVAQSVIDDAAFRELLTHPDADPTLTQIFSLLEPAIIAARSQPPEALGYDPRLAVALSQHPYPLGHMLYYAAGVMGLRPPPTFENHREPGGVLFLNSQPPAIVLGRSALQMHIPPQTAAFVAARQLAYLHPGFYVRRLLASTTALKAWLFGAFKLCTPGFPIAHEIEGPVLEARAALEAHLVPEHKDRLVDSITKLLHDSPAIDLKQWVTGVDLTADRVGLLLANDLETVVNIIKDVDDPASPPRERRLQELILYAVSEPFFAVRARIGVAIESLS